MKFEIDMSLVSENGEALGYFEGIKVFKNIPTQGEKSILFDDKSHDLPMELRNSLQQKQVLENLIFFDKFDDKNCLGRCLFSFFYIPSIANKAIFVSYFEKNYGLFFNDYSEH